MTRIHQNTTQHNTPKWQPLLEQARAYHALGFNVLPVRGKAPARDPKTRQPYSWRRWQTVRQTVVDVNCMPWRNATGIAAIGGAVSGGVVCIDFDKQPDRRNLDAFLAACDLPTDYAWQVTTPGGGFHLWIRTTVTRENSNLPGVHGGKIEWRGDSHYTLLPPSTHPNGGTYSCDNFAIMPTDGSDAADAYDAVTVDDTKERYHRDTLKSKYHDDTLIATTYAAYMRDHAQAAYDLRPPNGNGFSQLIHCPNPAHEDRTPSAAYNYANDSIVCHGCNWGTRDDMAAQLGVLTYAEFVHTYEQLRSSRDSRTSIRIEKSNDTTIKPPPKGYPVEPLPTRTVELLLNLHRDPMLNVAPGDLPNAGALAAVLTDMHDQQIAPVMRITANSLVTNSVHGLTWDTAKNGLRLGEELGIFGVSHPLSLAGTDIGIETPNIISRAGKPGTQYWRNPDRDAYPALLKYLAPHLLHVVLVTQFPDVPVSAQHVVNLVDDVTPDDIPAIDAACAGLYAQHEGDWAAALREYEKRLALFRAKYVTGILTPSEKYPIIPFELPAGVQTPNAAAFRNAVDDMHLAAHGGQRDAKARRDAARRTGRTLQAHAQAAKRRDILSIPQADRYPLDTQTDVITQCAAVDSVALRVGAIALVAETGARVYVNEESGRDYDDWIDQQSGTVLIEIRRASIEKRAALVTEDEHTAINDLSALQAHRASKRTGAIGVPKEHPSHAWAIRQGEHRAAACGLHALPAHDPRVYVDAASGEVFARGDVWRGICSSVREREGALMPTMTAYSAEALERDRTSRDGTSTPPDISLRKEMFCAEQIEPELYVRTYKLSTGGTSVKPKIAENAECQPADTPAPESEDWEYFTNGADVPGDPQWHDARRVQDAPPPRRKSRKQFVAAILSKQAARSAHIRAKQAQEQQP